MDLRFEQIKLLEKWC